MLSSVSRKEYNSTAKVESSAKDVGSQEDSQEQPQNRIVEEVLCDKLYIILRYPKFFCQMKVDTLDMFFRKKKKEKEIV